MNKLIDKWLNWKWEKEYDPAKLAEAAHYVVSTPQGQMLLQYWIDRYYCNLYEGNNPIELAKHEGAKVPIHELLRMSDSVQQPDKYKPPKQEGETDVRLSESTLKRTG